MSDEIIFANQKYKIQGNDELSGWAASDASSSLNPAVITASAETELLKLIFSLPPSLSSHSIFISSPSSSLNLSHCSLSLQHPSSALPFLFLSVESGILIIGNFSASSINLSDYPLISLSGSSAEAELMSAPWLNMAKCYFTEMERVTGSGGCVRCTAPAEEDKTGFGGGISLNLVDDYSLFVISSPIFEEDKPNVAKCGNDVFVESSDLTKSITNISLLFVSENLDDISLNSMKGFDGNDTTNAIPLVYFWRAIG